MTITQLQHIALRIGNQAFVRHYFWVNYPHEPQIMAIEVFGGGPGRRRDRSCECGVCPKCIHREYMRGRRASGRLWQEMAGLGFQYNELLGMWTIERTEAKDGEATATTGPATQDAARPTAKV